MQVGRLPTETVARVGENRLTDLEILPYAADHCDGVSAIDGYASSKACALAGPQNTKRRTAR
jgi:hypothetical protein